MAKDKTFERLGYKKKRATSCQRRITRAEEKGKQRVNFKCQSDDVCLLFLIIKAPSHLAVNQFKPRGEVGWCSFCVLSRNLTFGMGHET